MPFFFLLYTLTTTAPAEADAFDQYLGDPNKPVLYGGHVQMGMQRDYMTEDQRFAATRPDVLVYATQPLDDGLNVLGPIGVDLHVSTSGIATQRVYRSRARASAITLRVERP